MKSEIKEVFTVNPLPDDPPQGEIKVVANIGGEAPVAVNRDYQLVMQICFSVMGKNLDSRIVNPLLVRFKKQLKDYRLVEDGISVGPQRIDEFMSELIGTDLLICSQNILWQIFDSAGTGFDRTQAKLLKDMLSQGLVDEETSISIRMTDAVYHDINKRGRWPKETA